MTPHEILESGRKILDPVLLPHGFAFKELKGGHSSGGPYSSGMYGKTGRHVEIHFRFSLGLVTYHMGALSISHEAYMHSILGARGGNKYPGFSDDPLEAFRDLAFDLNTFCSDFLSGPGDEFAQYAKIADQNEHRSGFSRMADFES